MGRPSLVAVPYPLAQSPDMTFIVKRLSSEVQDRDNGFCRP